MVSHIVQAKLGWPALNRGGIVSTEATRFLLFETSNLLHFKHRVTWLLLPLVHRLGKPQAGPSLFFSFQSLRHALESQLALHLISGKSSHRRGGGVGWGGTYPREGRWMSGLGLQPVLLEAGQVQGDSSGSLSP